ncbi:histidine phosphatase family protein [Embleya sp. NBC_00896]|uniref:histidine phosphatase family protein n=1 Tax=Embleya sp. NBC_00896 TaxID=2975961 RepID=UPI0038635EDC|nr:histidine phosphatase family protein [Embleya sp. NBC_00896]
MVSTPDTAPFGPAEIVAVRHGESTANAAFAASAAASAAAIEAGRESDDADIDPDIDPDIAMTGRDADISLTALGEDQATAVGRRLALKGETPDVVLVSPYRRARSTMRIIAREAARVGLLLPRPRRDERLRDREMGVLELHTTAAIERLYPDEAARRRRVGDLYYRPPGGESLADVALRLRTLLTDLRHDAPGAHVLIVGHDATVLMLRYILEGLTETDVDRLVRTDPVGNASISRWRARDGRLRAIRYNDMRHLRGIDVH